MTNIDEYYAPDDVKRWRTLALGVGGIGSIVWAVGLFFDSEQALRSWLLGFIFWGGIGFGSLGVLILQYLTGGAWGVVIRRTVEAGSRTLPVIFLLFLPLMFGVTHLYEWTHLPPTDHIMEHRGWYMTSWGWILRSIVYFILFAVMVFYLNRWSRLQDESTDFDASVRYLEKASKFSGPILVLYSLVVTFAAVDWVMTLDPHWFSTIWGLLFVAGWALSCFCFVVAILAMLSDKPPLDRVLGKRHFHDLGKLMLALVMVWAYFNFSQFLIIWAGNIPEETGWFLRRMKGGWGWIGVGLIVFHFAFPFLVLLQQDFKRKARWLATLAIFILLMRLLDMFYLIAPNPRIHALGEDGAFIMLTPQPLYLIVLAKVLAQWLISGVPLVLVAPVLGLQFGLSQNTLAVMTVSLLLGTPVLSLIGSIGAALTLGLRSANVLVALLVLPLYIPVLIFGAGAIEATVSGAEAQPYLLLLGATLVLALTFAPWATAAALRISVE